MPVWVRNTSVPMTGKEGGIGTFVTSETVFEYFGSAYNLLSINPSILQLVNNNSIDKLPDRSPRPKAVA